MENKITSCKYKIVFLDLDGTLTYYSNINYKNEINDILKNSSVSQEFFWCAYNSIEGSLKSKYINRQIDDEDFRLKGSYAILKKLTKDAYSISKSINDLFIKSMNGVKLFDEVMPFLKKLKTLGVEPALLTNGTYSRQNTKIISTGLNELINHIYISGKVGYAKPDKRFFDFVLQDLCVSNSDAVYIGNSIDDDYKGAVGAGIDFVLMDRNNNNQDFQGNRVMSLDQFNQYILG